MGKLVVVFFTAFVQVAFGEFTPEIGNGLEELQNFVHEIARLSENDCQNLSKQPSIPENGWKFILEIDEIISALENTIAKYSKQIKNPDGEFLQSVRKIRTYLQVLKNSNSEEVTNHIKTAFLLEMEKLAKYMERWSVASKVETFNHDFYVDLMPVLRKCMSTLRKLYCNAASNIHRNLYRTNVATNDLDQPKNSLSFGLLDSYDITNNITEEIEVLIEAIDFYNIFTRQNFMYVVREYFKNLRQYSYPKVIKYYQIIFDPKKDMISMKEVKSYLFKTIKMFSDLVEEMHETEHLPFFKATQIFHDRLKNMLEINTPVRQLVFQIRVAADTLSTVYEIVPRRMKDVIQNHSQKFVEQLRHFASKMEELKIPDGVIFSWKEMVDGLEDSLDKHSLIVVLQESTTETHKVLMMYSNNSEVSLHLATNFLDCLNSQLKLASHFCQDFYDVDFWALHMVAITNRVSKYIHHEIYPEHMKIITNALKDIFKILDTRVFTEFIQTRYRLEAVIKQFENKDYKINTFLQKVAMELNQLVRDVFKRTGSFPKNVMTALRLYVIAIEQISAQSKINNGLLALQAPTKAVLKVEYIVDQFTRMLDIAVPGFQSTNQYYRGQYFSQILERAIYRLQKIIRENDASDTLLDGVVENLIQIQNNLKTDCKMNDLHFKVKFGMHLQATVIELKKLAFEEGLERGEELLKLYGDFLYGIEHMMSQIQYDFQVIPKEHTNKVLNMQIGPIAHSLLTALQRTQLKPELKRVAVTQIDYLSRQAKSLKESFAMVSSNKSLSIKYNKLHEGLMNVVRTGENTSVEGACKLLEIVVKELVLDLEVLTRLEVESQDLHKIYTTTLIAFSNILVRLENVHDDEYYYLLLDTHNSVDLIHKFSSLVLTKLQNTFADSIDVKHDAAIQTLMYARAVEKTAEILQVNTGLFPKRMYEVSFELEQLAQPSTIAVKTFGDSLKNHIRNVATEMGYILTKGSWVETDQALIYYMDFLEKMYIHTQHVFERSQQNHPLHYLTMHMETHVHYLTQTLEYIDPKNQKAVTILQTEYNRVFDCVSSLSKKIRQYTAYTSILQNIFSKVFEYEYNSKNIYDVGDLKIQIAQYVQEISFAFKELSWLLPEYHEYEKLFQNTEFVSEKSDVNEIFKSWFYEFLITVQQMKLEVEIGVILPQRTHQLYRWGFLEDSGRNYNEESDIFKEEYIGYRTKRQIENNTQSKQIKNAAQDMVNELNQVTSNAYEDKRDLILYIRKLIEMLIDVTDLLEEQEADNNIKIIIQNTVQIKAMLQEVFTLSTFYEVEELKTILLDAINLSTDQIATLPLFADKDYVSTLKGAVEHYYKYFNDVKGHIKDVVHGRALGSYKTKLDNSEKPSAFMNRILRIPSISNYTLELN